MSAEQSAEKDSLLQEVARHAATRRTEAEARVCSQPDCPGDGRYQPPGRGHLPDCQHDAVTWVWESIRPLADPDYSPSKPEAAS